MSNATFKRGRITENDAATGRSRVEFPDEDGVVSYWLSWNAAAAGGSKVYMRPDVGSQVHCLVDAAGEDGCILGASFSSADPPPTDQGDTIMLALEGGLVLSYERGSGALKIEGLSAFEVDVGGVGIRIAGGEVVTIGRTRLANGSRPVHRVDDLDVAGHKAVEGAPDVFA